MDTCMTSNSKNVSSKLELSCSKSPKDIKETHRVDTSQNNNAHIRTSFIPVLTKKNDMCHNVPKEEKEIEAKSNLKEVPTSQMRNILSSLSPPYRQKNLIDNEMLAARSRSHMRRHSVGFEDITSVTYCNGKNFSKDKRFQTVAHNPNVSPPSIPDYSSQKFHNDPVIKGKESNDSKLLLGRNENETRLLGTDKPLLQRLEKLKDKSFKRKSSLNRMDFIQPPIPSKDKISDREQKNTSSDENDSRPVKLYQSLTKRKHSSSPVAAESQWERKTNEVALPIGNSTSIIRSKILPRFNPLKIRNHKLNHTNASHFEKLSYSAGELETLASERTINSKTCLSAQEFDSREHNLAAYRHRNSRVVDTQRISSQMPQGAVIAKNTSKNFSNVAKTCDTASQNCMEAVNNGCHKLNSMSTSEQNGELNLKQQACCNDYDNLFPVYVENENLFTSPHCEETVYNVESSAVEVNGISVEEIRPFNLADADMEDNTNKIQSLEITTENLEFDTLGDDEELDYDDERRPSSILRKTYFEEKRELHGILKPTPDEKMSRTPPSILKHRESSEEKDVWIQTDLHSILKKSTSEDESYTSNPDIRPILKNNPSTDEESSGGTVRPRPILKKRTSFSEECSYASYASGELKPILKKKNLSSSDDQPRPILKTRRKSEDSKSTMEFMTGARPRAYSADMGVKSNHEMRFGNETLSNHEMRFSNETLNLDKRDSNSQNCDQHDL